MTLDTASFIVFLLSLMTSLSIPISFYYQYINNYFILIFFLVNYEKYFLLSRAINCVEDIYL